MRSGSVGVFVVQVWREPTEIAVPPWRASVLNTVTKERHYFASAEALVAFLSTLGLEQKTLYGLDDILGP
jgi:hypothetical protein